MYSHRNQRQTSSHIDRGGFTLVEMLVALALVMLMMTMFATIFQMATGSATKQRIIAESDQRSRQLTTIFRADFAKRSYRNSFPFLPNEDPTLTKVPFAARTGYIYISCNNVPSVQDDMIQFTVDARQVQTNPDDSRYYGAAALLFDQTYGTIDPTNPNLPRSPNQPEADDGELVPNGTASSNAAEISYFLRGGNLIRRIMLIRDPLPVAGQDLETQPKSAIGNDYFYTNGGGNGEFRLGAAPAIPQDDFWRYFDFSAVPTNMLNTPNGVTFVGIDALSNEGSAITASFGRPNFRFGFNPVTGLSREHEGISASSLFMGRYLQAETSANFAAISEDYNWPNAASSLVAWGPVNSITPVNNNPLDVRNAVSLNPTTGLVEQFDGTIGRGGVRRVEDVLMSNVREFKIELWDSRLERWVVPGHLASRTYVAANNPYQVAGDYHILRNSQRDRDSGLFTYGPLEVPGVSSGTPHVFDTWHPQIARDFDGDGAAVEDIAERQAPYYPLKYYPPRQNDVPPGPSPSSVAPSTGINPATEYDPISGRTNANRGYWTPGTPYSKDDVVFADNNLTPGWDANGNGVFEWDLDSAAIPQQSIHVAYRCMGSTNGANPPPGTPIGTSSATILPAWQSPGLTFLDNDLLWEGFQNYQPLKSVRVTIGFIEPNSETPKQLTLILPLTDAQ